MAMDVDARARFFEAEFSYWVCLCVIFFYDDKDMGTHITLIEVNWSQLPPSSVFLSVISQLARQPFFRPSSDTQSL